MLSESRHWLENRILSLPGHEGPAVPTECGRMQDLIPLLTGKGCLLLRIQGRGECRRGGIENKESNQKITVGSL